MFLTPFLNDLGADIASKESARALAGHRACCVHTGQPASCKARRALPPLPPGPSLFGRPMPARHLLCQPLRSLRPIEQTSPTWHRVHSSQLASSARASLASFH
eukprot:1799184-Pleurochrysis_carterae.AAC.3